MPNDARVPHARHGADRPALGTRLAVALRTRAGAGAAIVVGLLVLVAVGGSLGADRPTGDPASPAAQPSTAVEPVSSSTAITPGPSGPAPAPTPSPTGPPATGAPPSPSPSPSLDPTGVPAAALQARLDRIRERLSIPGVSVAILWDDGRQWLGASGLRNVRAGDAMTTGTAFALASISKTMTAGVVLQLVEEGRLSLDERVAPLLPGYDLHRKVTVRELLDHTSGIPDYFLNAKIDRPLQADKAAAWTPEQTWTFVAPPEKRFRPGRVWLYSNSNYLLLGQLVEAITGRSLASEVRDRILDPLSMESTWYQAVEAPRAGGTQGYRLLPTTGGGLRPVAVAKLSDVMPFRSVVTAAAGAGSVAATALDTARWMRAYAGGDLLGPEIQGEMLADVARTKALDAEIPYGLGIQALPIAGRPALGHSGRFLGFRNVVRYLPGEGVTVAVLTNQGLQDPARIAEGLLKVVLPPLPEPDASASPSPSS